MRTIFVPISKKEAQEDSRFRHVRPASELQVSQRLEPVKKLLAGATFTVTKEWVRDDPLPTFFLNGKALDLNDRQKLASFLQLVRYRYVPNRVLPTELIRNEHQSLRNVLIRRLAKKAKGDTAAFEAMRSTSIRMIESLAKRFKQACPDEGIVSLATPKSWQDLAFTFGYRLARDGVEIEDAAQGSGIQSLLMLETLYLIDRDYANLVNEAAILAARRNKKTIEMVDLEESIDKVTFAGPERRSKRKSQSTSRITRPKTTFTKYW